MKNMSLKTFFFSGTQTTKKIVVSIAGELAKMAGGKTVKDLDFTLPETRREIASFEKQDLVVAGVPVYAGRVPNVLLKYLRTVQGRGAAAVAVVVYGNRHYDDALAEWEDLLDAAGFKVIAAGAFIGEHSFSRILGGGRPDTHDMEQITKFAGQIYEKLHTQDTTAPVAVPGARPYRPYYQPRDRQGNPVSIVKVVPRTNDNCIQCGLCATLCPMGSIDPDELSSITGICIKCCACIKYCPVEAKYFDDENYLWHKQELEIAFSDVRREPEYFF